MKGKILAAIVLALILSAASVTAEETVFDQASKWVESWKAPCVLTAICEKAEPAKDMEAKPVRKMWTMDVLGNKVPVETMKDYSVDVK